MQSFKKNIMRHFIFLLLLSSIRLSSAAQLPQKPCSQPEYRQFDFWLGEWEAFDTNGQKAGDSK